MSVEDKKYMQRCLYLAKHGLGSVSPNPMVGSVIVKDGKIIGEGYHQKIGEAHAEVNAVNSVKNSEDIKSAKLYVNLEPCVHHGKTPPCTDMIIRHGIAEVIISMPDPNPEVGGKGIEKLRKNGIKVTTGVLEEEARYLNRRFITYFTQNRPYIILKWAETLDGYIDVKRPVDPNSVPNWITNKYGKSLVHKWRTEEDAFMVGTHTAIMDNPRLTVREWSGRNPVRLTLDYDNLLPENLAIFDNEAESIIFNGQKEKRADKLKVIKLDKRKDNIEEILRKLFEENIQSLVVEGGAELLNSFISKSMWDEARIFRGDLYFDEGVEAPQIKGRRIFREKFGNSELEILKR